MIRIFMSPDTKDGSPPGFSISGDFRKNDGNIEVYVSSDAMAAYANLYPPIGDGAPINPDLAAEIIARTGVFYGILWEELTEKILSVNTERQVAKDFLIASGKQPVSEYPEHIIIENEFLPGWKPLDNEKHSIDWKEKSPIIVVKKGAQIGRVIAHRSGQPGMTVNGKEIPFAKEQIKSYALAKNVERQEDRILASSDGRVVVDGQKVFIEEVLLIKGNVDYRIGHIYFPGDVIIEGGVAAGFKIYSGGSISIKETMDAFEVSAKGDLVCAQGIIGKDQGQVRVGGSLKAKFIENTRIAAKADIEVPGSIVGSRIFTLGKLLMGDKGRIVGGEIYATHGISCGFLGGVTRPQTILNVGIDFTVQQKLVQANALMQELSMRIARLQNILKTRQDAALEKTRAEIELKLRSLSENIAELNKRVDIDEEAVVSVKNIVYPGVVINICHIRINIDEAIKKASFRLDKKANRIIIER
ncbi:hypothetical protein MASR2M29_14010 [Spirochaetota bacterium]